MARICFCSQRRQLGVLDKLNALKVLDCYRPFGITVDPVWAKWAAENGVSETTTAALFLLSKERKAEPEGS